MAQEQESSSQGAEFKVTRVTEVQPLQEGQMPFMDMRYRYSGEWVAAKPIPNNLEIVYQDPDYTPSSQELEPYAGIILAHSKDENDLSGVLTPENRPIKYFKAEDANLTERERNQTVAELLTYSLRRLPGRIQSLLKTPYSSKNQPGGFDEYKKAMSEINQILAPHREWVDSVLDDPESHYKGRGIIFEGNTQKQYQEHQQKLHVGLSAAQVAAAAGYVSGLRYLGAEMVVEDINPKMTFAYFLGNLTNQQVGRRVAGFPPKDMIIDWAHKINNGEVVYRPMLEDLLGIYKSIDHGLFRAKNRKYTSY